MKKLLTPFILWYLRTAAKLQLSKVNPLIIGIGGSSGKSSLSRLIAQMLSDSNLVKQSEGKNSETGIPLDILDIHMRNFSALSWLFAMGMAIVQLASNWKKYDVYVAEMGIDSPVEPKNMSYLLKIIRPSIGVVTNISLEHSLYFEPYVQEINPEKKVEEILRLTAEQETLLLTSLPPNGTAIINADDPLITQTLHEIPAKKLSISTQTNADLRGKDVVSTLSRFSMIIEYQGKNYPLTISSPLPKHFAYEFLLALGVGLSSGLAIEQTITSLQNHFELPPGRLSIFRGIKETTLIDSTYNNATLPPILDILDFVKEVSGTRRKVAILGDMRELGQASEEAHKQVAERLLGTVDMAILIGPLFEKYGVPMLQKAEFPFENFPHVTSSKEAILKAIQPGDVILVKGSQNTLYLERIVEMLLEDKKEVAKLTRRGDFWDAKRALSF